MYVTQPSASAPDPRADTRHRPPGREHYRTTTAPLIVTPTFLTRADPTPRAGRLIDDGSNKGRHGQVLKNPDAEPAEVALEADPNLAWERWDEYWRKVHGPKFAYEEPGTDNEPALRYDQVHRVPGGPCSFFAPPYLAMTQPDGRLVADPWARVPPYQRPRFDGFTYIAYATEADVQKVLGQPQYAERIITDEQTAFRLVTRELAREYILLPSPRHRDALSLVLLHYRRPTVSREQLQERLLRHHAPLLLQQPATHQYVRRYAQLHNIGSSQQPDPEGELIDAVSVLAFASMNDVEDFVVSPDFAQLLADLAEITDPARSEYWTGLNYSVINHLLPEVATVY